MTAPQHLLNRAGLRTPDDGAENPLTAVGFDRPRHLRAIRVEVDGDHAGAALLDLGCPGPGGYVGCSGGVRDDQVTAQRATPEHLPGHLQIPVTAGRWAVLAGLHRGPAPGTAFPMPVAAATPADVDAKRARVPAAPPVPPVPPVPERGPRRTLPVLDGLP